MPTIKEILHEENTREVGWIVMFLEELLHDCK